MEEEIRRKNKKKVKLAIILPLILGVIISVWLMFEAQRMVYGYISSTLIARI